MRTIGNASRRAQTCLRRCTSASERRVDEMAGVWQDLRRGFLLLSRNPLFAVIAIATLAFGIGANTAVFTLINAVLLRPLPFRDPGRLVWVWATRTDRDKAF